MNTRKSESKSLFALIVMRNSPEVGKGENTSVDGLDSVHFGQRNIFTLFRLGVQRDAVYNLMVARRRLCLVLGLPGYAVEVSAPSYLPHLLQSPKVDQKIYLSIEIIISRHDAVYDT